MLKVKETKRLLSGPSRIGNNDGTISQDPLSDAEPQAITEDVDANYSPIDLSISKCKMTNGTSHSQRISVGAKLTPSKTMSLLPKVWHLCDLCDSRFTSKSILMHHFREIHKIQRLSRAMPEHSPEIEIIPIDIPSNSTHEQESLPDDFTYQPPSITIRRVSSSSGSSGNQDLFASNVNSQTHWNSSTLFSQFELMSEVCRVCSEKFSDKRSLTGHMKSAHPMESRFGCSICSKVLSSRAALIGHMRIHTGDKPFECSVCNRSFSNSQTLTRHFRTHTKEKPYSCPVCGKRASLRHNMKLHIKIHEKQMMNGGQGHS